MADAMELTPAIPIYYTMSSTHFAVSTFRELSNITEGNFFASTYGVHMLLLLLTVGAKSKTSDEIKSVVHMPKNQLPRFNNTKSVTDFIENPDYMSAANGIFTDKSFGLNAEYKSNAQTYFKAEVKEFDFVGAPTVGESEINEWSRNKTNGKIPKILDSGTITSDTALILASAVHFMSRWKHQFTEIKKSMFCLSPTKHIEIQMLHQTNIFNYFKNKEEKFSALELPYKGSGFDMLIVLPDKMDGVKALENSFLSDPSKFSTLLNNMTTHKVEVSVPKFKIESNIDFQKPLENLGCGTMFTPEADFSLMSSSGARNLKVNSIKHKSFVEVDEKGTEAAAVTVADIVLYSLEAVPPNIETVRFHACHPFLFFIKQNNNIMFIGRLSNPTA